jgi:phosphoenolpyruvate synthase/pyruvate phosphate dikinase
MQVNAGRIQRCVREAIGLTSLFDGFSIGSNDLTQRTLGVRPRFGDRPG